MIQPGHGTVLYNKEFLHLCCVARAERVDFKICTQDGTVILQNRLTQGAPINAGGYYIWYSEVHLSNLIPDTDYYVTYWYKDASTNEDVVIFNAFIYRSSLTAQYEDYPFTSNWITQSELDKAVSVINGNTNTKTTEINDKIETTYLGNKKVEMSYCTEVPSPNPRNLFIGCADYITEKIKLSVSADWNTPVSTKITYYWYDANQKQIKVGEQG